MDVAGTVSGLLPWGVKAHGVGPQTGISLTVRLETPIPLICLQTDYQTASARNDNRLNCHLVVENRVPKINPSTQKELKEQLRVAKNAQKEAVKHFKEIVREIPSGLPHPDGSDRIRNASRELADAHKRLVALLIELNRISRDAARKQRQP